MGRAAPDSAQVECYVSFSFLLLFSNFLLSLSISIFYLEFKFESGFMIHIHIKTLACKIKFYVYFFHLIYLRICF
jgi:hypothetical protein